MKDDLFHHKRKSYIEINEIYFWTATINKWQCLLSNNQYKNVIIDSLIYLSANNLIDIFAFVIMPNHLHLIWRINKMNGNETPQSSFLKFTAHEFKKMIRNDTTLNLTTYAVTAENKEYQFWRRDSLAIPLFTKRVAYQKLDYIHWNPCRGKWILVLDPCYYKYSSARYYEKGDTGWPFLKDLRAEF